MNNTHYEVLMKVLEKNWGKKRSDNFLTQIKKTLDEDQFECLSKMITYINEEVENLNEKKLKEITKNLDTFSSSLKFLEYFFEKTQPDLVDQIMETLNSDSEEVIDLLDSMEDQGILQYLVEFGAFYVWFR